MSLPQPARPWRGVRLHKAKDRQQWTDAAEVGSEESKRATQRQK